MIRRMHFELAHLVGERQALLSTGKGAWRLLAMKPQREPASEISLIIATMSAMTGEMRGLQKEILKA